MRTKVNWWSPSQFKSSSFLMDLYIGTVVLEIPAALIRILAVWILVLVISSPVWFIWGLISSPFQNAFAPTNSFSQIALISLIIAVLLAFSNIIWSLLTLYVPKATSVKGNVLTRFALGARPPSKREREMVLQAIKQIEAKAPTGIVAPQYWFVIDSSMLNAYVVGETLYVTRELIRSQFLAAVIAHELGHLNSSDATMILALRRLVLPHVYFVRNKLYRKATQDDSSTELVGSIAGILFASLTSGGLGLFLLNPLWTWYWRDREYYADNFAAQMGFASDLIQFLENSQVLDVAVPFYLSEHPYTELRIDRLQLYLKHPKPLPVEVEQQIRSATTVAGLEGIAAMPGMLEMVDVGELPLAEQKAIQEKLERKPQKS